jgi:hypothetical protein
MRTAQLSKPTADVGLDRQAAARQATKSTPSRRARAIFVPLGVIAACAATWALLSPTEPGSPRIRVPVANTQAEAATARVCRAFALVSKAVSVQTNANLGSDPVAREAVAANARLAALGGGAYLLSHLDPAAPEDLATAVRAFANDVEDIGMNQFAGTPDNDPNVVGLVSSAKLSSTQVAGICG